MAEQPRGPLTTPPKGEVRLSTPVLNERSRAKALTDAKHAEELGGKVIDRRAPIVIQKVDVTATGMQFGKIEQLPIDGTAKTSMRPGDPVPARAATVEQPEAPHSTLIPAEPAPEVAPPPAAIGIPAPVGTVVAKPKRIKVQFVGKGMGKTTVFCQEVVISDSLVVLAYPQNGDTAIVEPPVADSSDELMVKVTDERGVTHSYHVMSNEWSFEAHDLLWLVLIRVKPED